MNPQEIQQLREDTLKERDRNEELAKEYGPLLSTDSAQRDRMMPYFTMLVNAHDSLLDIRQSMSTMLTREEYDQVNQVIANRFIEGMHPRLQGLPFRQPNYDGKETCYYKRDLPPLGGCDNDFSSAVASIPNDDQMTIQ